MSYDIWLKDRLTGETLEVNNNHFMTGGTYAVGGTKELWLNITYNYAHYYYEATDGDPRFAHEEVSCVYFDGTYGPMEIEYGIRGIYGKTGAQSIQMLKDIIQRIEERYKKDGEWISTERKKIKFISPSGEVTMDPYVAISKWTSYTKEEYTIQVSEGPDNDYWEPTAGNAIRPLYQLIAFAEMRPDGVWDGD